MSDNKKNNTFNPVPYGVLYFGVFTSIMGIKMRNDYTHFIACLALFLSSLFFIAIFNNFTLRFLNHRLLRGSLLIITFSLHSLSFVLGWLQPLENVTGLRLYALLYGGFAWEIVFLLVLLKRLPNKWLSALSVIIMFLVTMYRFMVYKDTPGGIVLAAIFVLMLLVMSEIINPQGDYSP